MNHCEPYFLNHKNIDRFINKPQKTQPVLQPNPEMLTKSEESDTLFWNFFVAWKGEIEYEHTKLFNKIQFMEKQLKIEFLEKINANRKSFKKTAIAEENLMEKKVTPKTVILLAMIEKVNILFSFEKSFFLSINDDTKPYYHIYNGIVREISLSDLEKVKEIKIQRHEIDKILGSISNYKLADLKEMYRKISDSVVKKTKQQMYDEIKLC